MKIKEVQISNFRAFNDVKSSTFNFVNNKNEISDLISIYAPNGFGKTSFYDAVEWGITGKIERFDLVGDFEKTRKENKKGGNKNILQHIGASENGFVNVVTENSTFEEKITSTEYNHKKEPRNKFFRDVVLSQEMIDNFLKEQTAEERYNKFVESYPDVTKYNNTYKNIVSLLNYILQETKRIEKDKKSSEDKQLKIDFNLEFKKFDQINVAIQFLRTKSESIDLIQKETFNETLYDILTSLVKSRLVSLQLELDAKKLRIENIHIARNGDGINGSNTGVVNYIENQNKINDFELRIKELKEIISWIENKEKTLNEIDNSKKKISRDQEIQNRLLPIEKKIDTYFLIYNEIIEHEKRIVNHRENNLKIESDNSIINEINSRLQNEVLQLQNSRQLEQIKINDLENQKKKFELAKETIESSQKTITDLTNSITEKNNNLSRLQKKLNELNYYSHKINDDLGYLLDLKEFESQKITIEEQIQCLNKITSLKDDLIKIDEKINSQNQLNDELKNYVARGLDIVSKNHSSECPLCHQDFESFEQLSRRIVENNIFSEQQKESLENRIRIENEIKNSSDDVNLRREKIIQHLNELQQPIKIEFEKTEKDIEKLSLQKDEKNAELDIAQANLNEVMLFFNNESDVDLFEKNTKVQIENLTHRLNELSSEINSNTSKINENQNQLKSNLENIEILRKAIDELKSIKEYLEVINFFKQELNSNDVNKDLYNAEKLKLEQSLANVKRDLDNEQKSLSDLENKLSSFSLSKEDYLKRLEQVEQIKLLTLKVYESFENFIRTEFNIELKGKDKGQIDLDFDNLISQEKSNQEVIEDKIERYKIIDTLKEDCLNATVSQKIESEINAIKSKLKELKAVVSKLEAEKKNLEKYLERTIDEFFYTGLINAIYTKIDPHPDYDSIEFKCEFGESKPRLQIFTIKADRIGKDIKSIPALYFSTAQINILSLSIFLARALKTKNPKTDESIDCIFIDDPIQSMDSINILSFIDLFRGIITSLGKQLIVSTHEENFHLLLQKKIPKEFFKSKFIEFETFGKLKLPA